MNEKKAMNSTRIIGHTTVNEMHSISWQSVARDNCVIDVPPL